MSNQGALSDVTIIDLTRVLSGPLCTCWLSDMGANVIKVENPRDGGDATRVSLPFVNGVSVYYATINRNKRTVTLNLKDPRGKELLRELVKDADVVVENFRPGVMDKLGLGFEDLKKINPRIVYASLSGYGSYGPYADRAGYDVVGQGMGAIMSYTGQPDDPPTKCGPSLGDVTAGMNLCIGILAALTHARSTGEGQYVETSLVDSVLALCTQDYIDYGQTKVLPKRMGNDYSLWCPYGSYKAADKYFQIGIGTEKHFAVFADKVLHKPELVQDSRFNSQGARVENRKEMDALVYEWCSKISAKEAVAQLSAWSIPASLVYDFADVDADENFTTVRQMVKHMEHPVIGDIPYINCPIRFFGTPLVEPKPAQELGACNDEVYGGLLGRSEEELAQLKADGVI